MKTINATHNNRTYLVYDEEELDFVFEQNQDDFIVDEIFNDKYNFDHKDIGNYMILHIKKNNLSTWELISYVAEVLDIKENEIGYAGLKDKHATTTQYISIPLNKSNDYKNLNNRKVKVLRTFRDKQSIKIGDHNGNKFTITLKEIKPEQLHIFYKRLSHIQKHGMPNYFGYQRFGNEDNFAKSKALVEGDIVIEDRRLSTFLKKAYQSYFFNDWLCKRVEISKEQNSKKLISLDGDVFNKHNRDIITGLLPGRDIVRAKNEASVIEKQFDDIFIHEKGLRRDAWITPLNIKNKLKDTSMTLEFTLPKSSYATVFIEALQNQVLSK